MKTAKEFYLEALKSRFPSAYNQYKHDINLIVEKFVNVCDSKVEEIKNEMAYYEICEECLEPLDVFYVFKDQARELVGTWVNDLIYAED